MAFGSSKQNNISALAIAVASALTVSASAVQAQEEAAVEEKDVEKVVVTGSRVAQDSSLEAASPVLAINAGHDALTGSFWLGQTSTGAKPILQTPPARHDVGGTRWSN